MNDFQMSFLSNDHRDSHMADARRERLAHSARQTSARSQGARLRRPRRPSLSLLFGRASA